MSNLMNSQLRLSITAISRSVQGFASGSWRSSLRPKALGEGSNGPAQEENRSDPGRGFSHIRFWFNGMFEATSSASSFGSEWEELRSSCMPLLIGSSGNFGARRVIEDW